MWDGPFHWPPLLLPRCHHTMSSPPQVSVSAPPTHLNEYFLFKSLVVRYPYSLIFWQFWLFFVLRLVVILLLVVQGGKHVYLNLHLGQSPLKTYKFIMHFHVNASRPHWYFQTYYLFSFITLSEALKFLQNSEKENLINFYSVLILFYFLLLLPLHLLFYQHRGHFLQCKGKSFGIVLYHPVSMVTSLFETEMEQIIWQFTCTYVAKQWKLSHTDSTRWFRMGKSLYPKVLCFALLIDWVLR